MPSLSVATSFSSARADTGLGRLAEVELAERLLELLAHALERRVRIGRDHRADELEGEPDRARLERGQPRRRAERVAEELLLDVDLVAVELGVDRVAAAAEVDEVQELEVLLDRLGRDVEAHADVRGREHRVRVVTAAVEQVREQGLQEPEALRRDGAGRPLVLVDGRLCRLGRDLRRFLGMALVHQVEVGAHLAPELRGRERHRPPVLTQDPGGELPEVGVVRDEDAVLDPPVAAEEAVDPPGRVAGDLDLGLALLRANLPRRALAVGLGVEALRHPEVALAPRGEADLASDPRHAERLDPLVVEVETDHVPLAAVEEQRIGIDRALAAAPGA